MDLVSFLLEKTGSLGKDCFEYDDRIIFLVNKDDIGRIIGESGSKINGLRRELNKNIDIIAYNSDFTEFIKNIFYPVPILLANVKDAKIEIIVEKKNIGRAIGRQGSNLKKIKFILDRHFEGVQGIQVKSARPKKDTNN